MVLHGNDSGSDILSQDHLWAQDRYHEWCSGQKPQHVCALICPPHTCTQCNCKRYLWCTHYGGCAFGLATTECHARGGVLGGTALWVCGFTILLMASLLCSPLLHRTMAATRTGDTNSCPSHQG